MASSSSISDNTEEESIISYYFSREYTYEVITEFLAKFHSITMSVKYSRTSRKRPWPKMSKGILYECESFFKDLYSSMMKTDSILPETDFFLRERHPFKQRGTRFHWRFVNWIGMSQCFEGLWKVCFWSEVSKPLLEALNYGFKIGQLSISQNGV